MPFNTKVIWYLKSNPKNQVTNCWGVCGRGRTSSLTTAPPCVREVAGHFLKMLKVKSYRV